jgi:hypothetical protein
MASASGLPAGSRLRARERAVQAALLMLHHAPLHYDMNDPKKRWEGIRKQLNSRRGEFPRVADCSSFVTWCLWNALFSQFGLGDVVNGQGWKAGYTGTMLSHGLRVQHVANILRGDCVHYEDPAHVTIVVDKQGGVPHVVGHGHEGGPFYTRYDYRTVSQIRRYI